MDNYDISVIIVSYNVKNYLEACLTSLFEHPTRCTFDVWVVDNASTDGSSDMVRDQFPEVHLIQNQGNVGFASANNQAIRQCKGRYVFMLNPDTLAYENALDPLVDFLDKNPKTGAVGSRLLNPDGSLQPSCFPFPTLGRELWRMFHLDTLYPVALYRMERWDRTQPKSVDMVQGTALALRHTALNEVGLLDEDFFMYSEEVDLCYRLKKSGWDLYWIPTSRVVHYGGQSTQQMAANMFLQLYWAKIAYFRKHHGKGSAKVYKGILMLASLARLGISSIAWLEPPTLRERHLKLAGYYQNLLKAIAEF